MTNVDIIRLTEKEGRDARNVVSWRVPNEPQEPANLRVTVNESGAPCPRKAGVPGMGVWGLGPKEVKMSEKKIKNSRDTRKSPSTLQPEVSPPFKARVRSYKAVVGIGKDALPSPSSGKDERNRIRKTFWSYLFRNVNRAVDELYYLCEAEASTEHCEEAAKLLESCGRDFVKLVERIEVQSKFEEEQKLCESDYNKAPKGVGWEVRKTTASGHGEQSAIIMDAIERMSGLKCNNEESMITLTAPSTPRATQPPLPLPEMDVIEPKRLFSDEEIVDVEEPVPDGRDASISAITLESEENEEATDAEVAKASEEVWAEAEAWVEAEVKAEEEAWLELDKKLQVVTDDDSFADESTDMIHSFDVSAPTTEEDNGRFFPETQEEEHWFHLSSENSPCGSSKSCFSSPPSSPVRSGSGGMLDFALNRKYLRDKLSSPERKKPTPAEAKRRLDEKHFLADMKRAYLDSERQHKLRIAADRIRDVNERRSMKLAQAERVYQQKLGRAEQRQKAYIQAIARKAENESSKVKEVSFINNLTAESLKVEITERLEEVENRIQAGRARRQEHLHGIRSKQKKREREKARQMSERRLEMEKQAAVRWEKLQERIIAVQVRRNARLEEIQRRRLEAKTLKQKKENSLSEEGGKSFGVEDIKEEAQQKQNRKEEKQKQKETEDKNKRALGEGADGEDIRIPRSIEGSPHGGPPDKGRGWGSGCNRTCRKRNRKLRHQLLGGTASWFELDDGEVPNLRGGAGEEATRKKLDMAVDELQRRLAALQFIDVYEKDCSRDPGYLTEGESDSNRNHPMGQENIHKNSIEEKRTRRKKGRKGKKVATESKSDGASVMDPIRLICQQLEPKNEAINGRMRDPHCVKLLVDVLGLEKGDANKKPVEMALHAIHIALQYPSSRDVLLALNGGVPIIDIAEYALGNGGWKDPEKDENFDFIVGLLSPALSSLTLIVRHVPHEDLKSVQVALFKYICQVGFIQHLSETLNLLRDQISNQTKGKEVCLIITKLLTLLEALSAYPRANEGRSGSEKGELDNITIAVIRPFHDVSLGVLVRVLSSLLMHEHPQGSYDVEDISNSALSWAWLILRAMNNICLLELSPVQKLLASDILHSYFNYGYSMLLRVLSSKLLDISLPPSDCLEVESCLEQLLILLGLYFLENPENQRSIASSPILISRLSNLPFRYFCDDRYKDMLFPALIAVCFRNNVNKGLLNNEMHCGLLSAYIKEKQQKHIQGGEGVEFEGNGGHSSSAHVAFSERFSMAHWSEGINYFEE